ncbi:diguanylate cyclase [Mycolicibacterium sp.]|uniref:diguanylate cyclase n=1 Tax=Mycolicibacterium sp. TaxID=2320850 RepID=UPI0037C52437
MRDSSFVTTVQQWWRDPGDYVWLVDYLDVRGLLHVLKAAVSVFGAVMAILAVLMQVAPTAYHGTVGRVLSGLLAVVGVVWALLWWRRPWPHRRESVALITAGDISIGLACLLHADALVSIAGTPLFAVVGAYVAFFHNAKVHACHVSWVTAVIAAVAIQLALQDWPNGLALAASKAVIALMVSVGILPVLQFGFWTLRHNWADALTDPLTSLINRRGLEYATRPLTTPLVGDSRLCAILIDLDRFKSINDTYGHSVGDEVLVRTATRIRTAVRREAVVARLGGEEFLVLDRAGAHAVLVAERIRTTIAASAEPTITASIGVAIAADTTVVSDLNDLIKAADQAMYVAKQQGGNAVHVAG